MANPNSICSVEGCSKKVRSLGLCQAHHLRKWRHGDPLAGGTGWGAARRFYEEHVLQADTDECVTWPYATTRGYGTIRVGGRTHSVSRLACRHRNGPEPSPQHEAAHSCGRGHLGCVNPRHLRWATKAENMADQYAHGVRVMGERHGNAKITEDDVREIRALNGVLPKARVAKMFNISRENVRDIQSGRRWGWLEV